MVESAIIEIENQYFEILEKYYSDLYDCYIESNKDLSIALSKYKSKQIDFVMPGYKNPSIFRKEQCKIEINEFWDKNYTVIENCIRRNKNIGVFGGGDSFSDRYRTEISSNSLFYELLVFNEPIYGRIPEKLEMEMEQGTLRFWHDIINILDIKQYIITNNGQHFIVIFPLAKILSDKEREDIMQESWEETQKYVSDVFGLGKGEFWEDIAILKDTSLEEAQTKLFDNGLYYRIDEAMNYSQSLISEKERRDFEQFCFESWGTFNRDFLRCYLMRAVIPNLTMVSFSEYKKINAISTKLNSNPILDRNDWMPLKSEAASSKFRATEDYLFCCSVHRNDKMNALISLTPEELLDIRSKNEPSEFRDFFHKVTGDMYHTYDELDEISEEVYSRFDEMLDKTVGDIKDQRNISRFKSIVGLAKTGAGLVPSPLLTVLITINDVLESCKNLFTSMKNKETIIEHIHKNKGN